jgi:hypothetical protein
MSVVITQGRYHPEMIVKTERYDLAIEWAELALVKS